MRRFRMVQMMVLGVGLTAGAVLAQLAVVNGDFSDQSGLKPHGGHGWHEGVPAGWRSTASALLYAVHAGADGKQPACNVSQLGILEQSVGTLDQAADVTLTLDVADVWQKGAELSAEMLDGDGETLASLQLKPGRAQRLVAGKVPAGTTVIIRFKALNSTTPALDNVSVVCAAPGSLVPTPQVSIRRFQLDQPLARARRVASVSADLESGSDTDAEVMVSLSLPPGVRLVASDTTSRVKIPTAEGCSRLTWRLEAEAPLTAEMFLELKAADGQLVAHQPLRMLVLPPVEKSNPPSIPEPVPAPASLLVGAHHCPLWESDKPAMWLNVLKHPERTPALGFYSQEQPEVSDWETKWAVEHGISFFIYCWYRTNQGGAVKTRFGSAIHDALFKSRFADKMKFTIMWENQVRGQAGVADERDLFTNLLPYWLDSYFKHPSYLKVDNKPVLFIYRPEFLVEDLGGVTNVVKAFTRMRQVCRDAGFDGLYLLGEYRGRDPKHLTLMKSLGLDYTFAYCWYLHGSPPPDQAIRTQMEYIRETQALNILPQVVTVSQAWSGWQDEGSIWKIPPSGFEQLLREAKAFTATLPAHELGSRMLLLDNWNEWGEGHYIAPYREYGFGYLDAVRKVFSSAPEAHEDLLPEDVGRGPYDQAVRAHFTRETMNRSQTARKVTKPGAPRGAVAWWTFDEDAENGVALDYSGHRLGGNLHKASRAPGYQGRALVCQGGCAVVSANDLLSLTGPFTIECRVKADCAGQNNTWFLNRVFGGNEASGYRLGVMDGKPCFHLPLTAWSHHLVGAEPLPAGCWVHLAATFDGLTMRLYMNGEACGALERPGPVRPNDNHLVLGNFEVDHPAFFKGLLDEVRLYRRALSAAEIRGLALPFWSPTNEPPPAKSSDLFPLERPTNQGRVVTPYTREALKEFALPGAPYRMNFIFHDYPKVQYVTPAQIIQEGGGGVVLNDVWDASYLQDDSSVTQLKEQLAKLQEAGANVWIYDEQIFPSGSAGGLVLTNNPEYASTGLSQQILAGAGATNVSWRRTADFDRIVGAYALLADGTRQRVAFNRDAVTWAGAEGKWTLHIFTVSQMYEHTPSQVCGLHLKLFNQLSAAATKKFMDVTFEFYKKHIPGFSETVDAFFMDEPSLQEIILNGTLPHAKVSWADNVEWQFYRLHGYDIALHYDSLFQGDSPNDMAVRCDYRETLAHLYAANYIGQMQAWAKKNNTLSSGHLTFEENILWHVPAYGNLMTALKYMGAPGCDNLAATYKTFMNTNVGLWDSYNWFMAPVYAGSAARMAGKQSYVMVELCPTTDGMDGRFATKADAFKIANLTFKSGVNHINSYAQLWNFKEGTSNYFKPFADYTARMAYMLRKANYDSRVGLYYPIETIQGIWKVRSETLQDFTEGRYGTQVQHAIMGLVQGCWAAGWDSTLVDADSITIAKIEGKALVINGVAFEAMVLPYAKIMKPEILRKLLDWERAGGKLVFVGELPHVATDPDRHEEVAALVKGRSLVSVKEAVRQSLAAVENPMTLTGGNIYASRYELGDKKMYLYINMDDAPQEIAFAYPQAKGFDLYDNMTGTVVSINGPSGAYTLPANGSAFVVVK